MIICSFSVCEKTEDNECCHFPYLYEGKEFNVCAMTAKGDRTWCSLTYDYDKDQQWRYCKGINYTCNSLASLIGITQHLSLFLAYLSALLVLYMFSNIHT